jgi:hypothetical protein
MNVIRVEIHIKGITPLMQNRFTDEQAMIASGGTRGSSAAADRGTPLQIAESKLYLGLKGKPMVPQPNLMRCIVDGGYFHKIGKKQVTTKESSLVYACLSIEGAEIALRHKQPWKVDTRPVVIPATKGRILAHRPMFDDWELHFNVELDTSIMGTGLLRKIVDDAGKRIGIGELRPAKKGPYGRFVVILWKEAQNPIEIAEAAE